MSKPLTFETKDSCRDLETFVRSDHRYRIRLTDVAGWADGADASAFPWQSDGYPATPIDGVENPGRLMDWSSPFARVTSANFMEPLTEVRTHDQPGFWGFTRKWFFGPDIDIRTTQFSRVGEGYEMTFCPRQSGDLYFMVNDMGLLYGNNSGSAKIEVADLGRRDIETAC